MKILVSCDERCYKLGEDFYMDSTGLTIANRYLMVFETVRLAIRTTVINDQSQLGKYNTKVSDSRIEIWPVDSFQGPIQYLKNYVHIKKQMHRVCDGCQLAILRLPSTTAFATWEQVKKAELPYATELVFDCYDAFKLENGLLNKALWWRMHQKQVSACKHAIGVAPVTRDYLQKHYTPNDENIVKSHYSSIELTKDFFYQPRKYPSDKQELSLAHVASPIQFNGRKGHNDLLHVLKTMKEHGLIINISFVGNDRFGGIAKLKDLAKELGVDSQVTFTGFLNKTQMRDLLINSDIAILPTKAEGLPRVMIEAMAMGLPCITTNVSGNPELINEPLLFEYGDREAIASMITRLVQDKALYESESADNFRKSQEYEKSVLDARRKEFFQKIREKVEMK